METKFSVALKDVISNSRLICLEMGFGEITHEMFILAMLKEENGALRSMKASDVDLDRLAILLKEEVSHRLEKTAEVPTGNIPLTKKAERALKLSVQQTIRFGKKGTIDTIHLLLSIIEGFDKKENEYIEKRTGLSLVKLSEHIYYDSHSKFVRGAGSGIEEELQKSKERILELKKMSEEFPSKTNVPPVTPLSLFFNMEEYSKEEIKEIMALLSELYHQHSGDHLVIKGASQFEMVQYLACV